MCMPRCRSELITTQRSLKLLTLSIVSPIAVMLGTEYMSVYVDKLMENDKRISRDWV